MMSTVRAMCLYKNDTKRKIERGQDPPGESADE